MENIYKENIEETKQWNIAESEGSRGEWSEGEIGCGYPLLRPRDLSEKSDNFSENSSVSSDQDRRLSIRNSSFLRHKSSQSFHWPAKYVNGRLLIYQRIVLFRSSENETESTLREQSHSPGSYGNNNRLFKNSF